jgi:hypothetical protein
MNDDRRPLQGRFVWIVSIPVASLRLPPATIVQASSLRPDLAMPREDDRSLNR